MPEYHFVCQKCKTYSAEHWHISEYDDKIKKNKCRQCGSKKVYRAYDLDNVHTTVKEIKTIGQLAEANTKKLGKYGLEEKTRQDNKVINKEQQDKKDRIRKINKMTPQQKEKWIVEGD